MEHRLVSISTWEDTTIDGFAIVSADWSCTCGIRRVSQTPGRTGPEARGYAQRWHEVHDRVARGKWPPLYDRLRRLPPMPFMAQFPYLAEPRGVEDNLALLAVEAGDPAYARKAGVL